MIKRRQWLARCISVCALLSAMCAICVSCDRSVAVEIDVVDFTDVYAPGVCPSTTEDKIFNSPTMKMSMVLMSRTKAATIMPDTFIGKLQMSTSEALSQPSTFDFSAPQNLEGITGDGFVESEENQSKTAIDLTDPVVTFEYNGVDPTQEDPRKKLVILLMDQSATFIGRDPNSFRTTPETTQASDLPDHRVAFFQGIAKKLNEYNKNDDQTIEMLAYKFYKSSVTPITVDANSRPVATANVDALQDYLDQLKRDEDGGTPLIAALNEALVVSKTLSETYQTSIFLFTDGIEGGDSSTVTADMKTVESIGLELAQQKVPVFTVHLQPKIRVFDDTSMSFTGDLKYKGRSPELQNLACITSGEYLFLENETFLTKPQSRTALEDILINRLQGRWMLEVKTNVNDINKFPALMGNKGYLLSTNLQVTLGDVSKPASVVQSTENDRRIWIYKNSNP